MDRQGRGKAAQGSLHNVQPKQSTLPPSSLILECSPSHSPPLMPASFLGAKRETTTCAGILLCQESRATQKSTTTCKSRKIGNRFAFLADFRSDTQQQLVVLSCLLGHL